MAITTYAELQAAVASWLARDDLTSYIPDFITLFEAVAARKLKVRPMETTATLSVSSGTANLPSDYIGVRSVSVDGVGDLTHAHPSYLRSTYPSTDQGSPQYYTIEGETITFRPVDDTQTFILRYFAKSAALSSALNWLFTNHPDAYLFGTLCEAHLFTRDTAEASIWRQRRDEVFDEIKAQTFNNAAALAVRAEGPTP